MTVQVVELQRAGGKFYFIVPAEFEPMAMLHEELADESLRTNMICMCHDKAKADMIAAAFNAPEFDIVIKAVEFVRVINDPTKGIECDEEWRARDALDNAVMTMTTPTTEDGFSRRVSKSTYVKSVYYHDDKRDLDVIFQANPGFLYSYHDFPSDMWAELQAAESVGSYISRVVVGPTGKNRPPVPPFKYTKRAVSNG